MTGPAQSLWFSIPDRDGWRHVDGAGFDHVRVRMEWNGSRHVLTDLRIHDPEGINPGALRKFPTSGIEALIGIDLWNERQVQR
jgi:hypothetical protein